jgi:hypothetical protein
MSTFGNTTVESTASTGWADYLLAGKFTLSETADVSKLTATVSNGANAMYVKGVIYADSTGYPGARQGMTPATAIASNQAKGAQDFTFSSAVRLNAGTYHLTLHTDDQGSGFSIYVATTGGNFTYISSTYASGVPDPFPGSGSTNAWNVAIFATYTPVIAVPTLTASQVGSNISVGWS